MKKIAIYLLAVLMLLSVFTAFAGCDTADGPDVDENGDDASADVGEIDFPDVERKDYGEEFNLYVSDSNGGIRRWYMDADLNSGSALDEAVFSRQERVRKYLGVEFVRVTYPDAKYNDYHTYVQSAVQNMDGTLDALITHVHGGVINLISENMLTDLSQLDGIDLDAEYWHKDFMNTLELNGNYFLGHSDYNIMITYVIGYNKDLLNEYEAALDKSIYDTVRDYEWTLEKMMSVARLVAIDSTGDGKKTPDDYFGISGTPWVAFNGFLTSSNIPMVAQTQSGAYEVALKKSEYQAKTDDLVNFFRELNDGNYSYFVHQHQDIPEVLLSSGHTLMQVMSTTQLEGLLNYNINFGVLPYPMYDEDQRSVGYKSLQWGGYIGALSYLENKAMVGETLEMLSYYSENVKITYYEKVLGKRIADMPDDAAMLEIIWAGVATDIGQTFCQIAGNGDETGVCYTIPQLIHPNTTSNLASYLGKKEGAINDAFKKFLSGID